MRYFNTRFALALAFAATLLVAQSEKTALAQYIGQAELGPWLYLPAELAQPGANLTSRLGWIPLEPIPACFQCTFGFPDAVECSLTERHPDGYCTEVYLGEYLGEQGGPYQLFLQLDRYVHCEANGLCPKLDSNGNAVTDSSGNPVNLPGDLSGWRACARDSQGNPVEGFIFPAPCDADPTGTGPKGCVICQRIAQCHEIIGPDDQAYDGQF